MASNAYRDALSAVGAPFERIRDQVLAKGAGLSGARRRALPARLRGELDRLEEDLNRQRGTVDEVLAAEQLLGPYEQCLAAALVWDEQRRAQRHRRSRRWRTAKRVGGIALAVLTPLAVWWGKSVVDRHEDLSWQCTTEGDCTVSGRCEARWGAALFSAQPFRPWRDCLDPDCSQACARFGQCCEVFGVCIAVRQEDCLESAACQQDGECTLVEGKCTIATGDDCQSSCGCRERGLCTVGPSSCIAKRDSDCLSSEGCERDGRCRPEDGRCVSGAPKPKPCEQACQRAGRCEHQGDSCRASSDVDCAFSDDCASWGRCAADQGRCVANRSVYCRQSLACTQMGRCHARDGECYRR